MRDDTYFYLMTMTLLLGAVSSMTGLSEDVVLALLIIAVTLVLTYIFYPAISLSLADSIAITEETVSTTKTAGKESVVLCALLTIHASLNTPTRLSSVVIHHHSCL